MLTSVEGYSVWYEMDVCRKKSQNVWNCGVYSDIDICKSEKRTWLCYLINKQLFDIIFLSFEPRMCTLYCLDSWQ